MADSKPVPVSLPLHKEQLNKLIDNLSPQTRMELLNAAKERKLEMLNHPPAGDSRTH